MALFSSLPISAPLLSPRDTGDFRQVLHVHEYWCGSLGHCTPGARVGSGTLPILSSETGGSQREGRGRVLARLKGVEDMLFTGMDKESISSSSTQVTLQPLQWELDSKLVTEN